MDFSKDQYKRSNSSFLVPGNVLLCLFTVLISYSYLSAQEYTRDNYKGIWTDNVSWVNVIAPNITDIDLNISIYSNILHAANIYFNVGDHHVYDTLDIFGDLSIGNNTGLFIYSRGILFVRGDSAS